MRSVNRHPLFRSGLFIAFMTFGFLVTMAMLPVQEKTQQLGSPLPPLLSVRLAPQTTHAQQRYLRIEEAAERVYTLVPDLPLENQYVNMDTGQVSDRNTLISRLIRYHSYVKGRPFTYRLDWKLTLADYLGANERVTNSTYPGHNTLRPDPLAGDIAAVNRLTRAQRNQLVDALVSVYVSSVPPTESPSSPPATANPVPSNPRPAPQPAPRPMTPSLRSPQAGDAQLLAP